MKFIALPYTSAAIQNASVILGMKGTVSACGLKYFPLNKIHPACTRFEATVFEEHWLISFPKSLKAIE